VTAPPETATEKPAGIGTRLTQAAKDPRIAIVFLITLILVIGNVFYHILEGPLLGGYDALLTALASCMLTEILLSEFLRGKFPVLVSAYISGISLTLLLKTPAFYPWPFAIGGFVAIASKYVLTWRGNHLFNPTNFAICALLLVAPGEISILSHQFGNDLATNAVIWVFGLLIAKRANVLHVTVAYLASFVAFAALRAAWFGLPFVTEVAPVTGPMYQLFVFFMITDPRTTVGSTKGRVLVAVLIAAVECGIRCLGEFGVDLGSVGRSLYAGAPLYGLFLVGPVAKATDQERRHRA
jgi:Na+-translocating ferredoxin:NAD+ oxidoreductase RnfD subunit